MGEVQEALANGLNSHLDFFDDGAATLRRIATQKRVKACLLKVVIIGKRLLQAAIAHDVERNAVSQRSVFVLALLVQ